MTLGERIKLAIKQRGITQKKLSEITGIPQSSLVDIIKSRVEPSVDKVRNIAQALGLNLNWLILGTDYNPELQENPVWRVSDGGGKYSTSSGSFSKRMRILYMYLPTDKPRPELDYWEECFDILNNLVQLAREHGFKEDIMWVLTGHTREQMLAHILDPKIFEILKSLEELPDTKQDIVKSLLEQMK